jgi:flagellar hook-length control protein FliK
MKFNERRKRMKITDTTLTGVGAITAKQQQQHVQVGSGSNGFDLIFANASQRVETTADTQNRSREDDRGRGRTEDSRANRVGNAERASRRENSARRAEETTEAAAPQDTAPIAPPQCEATPEEVKIDEEQALAAVAMIMEVPAEVIVETMNEQGLAVQDLTDPKAVSKYLQAALEVDSPMELLTNPEFPEKFKAINEAMGEMLQEAEVEQALAAQTTEVGAKAAQQYQKGTGYATNMEGLEVLNENGELIVTDEAATDEIYATTTRTQSNRDASATTQQQSQTTGQTQESVTTSHLPMSEEVIVEDQQSLDPMLNTDVVTKASDVQTTRSSAPTQPVKATDVIEQIMSQVKITKAGGQFTEMKMTLRPESLGDIVLRVLTQNGIVVAQFEAESQRVKEALESNFNQLRDALEEQGIQFSELSVSVRQDENERMNQFERERQRTRHRADAINGEEVLEEAPTITAHRGVIDITA